VYDLAGHAQCMQDERRMDAQYSKQYNSLGNVRKGGPS